MRQYRIVQYEDQYEFQQQSWLNCYCYIWKTLISYYSLEEAKNFKRDQELLDSIIFEEENQDE